MLSLLNFSVHFHKKNKMDRVSRYGNKTKWRTNKDHSSRQTIQEIQFLWNAMRKIVYFEDSNSVI